MKETIIVDAMDKRGKISRHIYGHFSEHLGRCIYGGFWVGKNSPIPNVNGLRKDVIEAFKEIKIPNLRWPGGCFADEYHWRDGVGVSRARMVNSNWGNVVEDNSFGTHEFFALCDELGCEPYVCGNVGSGSPREMGEWIEYMTFSGESPMASLRAANGRKEPWPLQFFGVGNENFGGGGNMRAEYYADLYRRFQTFVRQYGDKKILKIASGFDLDWTETMMERAAQFMDGLSLHYYTYETCHEERKRAALFDEEGWYRTMRSSFGIDGCIRQHSEAMDKYDKDRRVMLAVDEWGCWHASEPGTNPAFLYQQNTMRDAVVAATQLNIFNSHCERVRMANIAQAVNVLQSPVLTQDDEIVLTPTWHVFNMYKNHQDATSLGVSVACESAGVFDKGVVVPSVSASASEKILGDGKTRFLVTVAGEEFSGAAKSVSLSFAHLPRPIESARGTALNGEEAASFNTFGAGDKVSEKSLAVKTESADTVSFDLPAHSVVALEITA